ncbi:MAG: Holliday junction resolvase RuvX [bacterium]|nr:Holliday junction resolvase RuvX [bacterium]
MRLLGIDYGGKRIGIALSDEDGRLAFPHSIITNDAHTVKRISDICKAESVKTIILGESRTYKGIENLIMKKIVCFKKEFEATTGLPVFFEPELLTSQEAKRGREVGSKKLVDDSAAAIILQSYLDKVQEQRKWKK